MCVLCEPINIEKAGENLLDALNKGALSVMLSIGHQTGLFENLKSGEAFTSHQLAKVDNLDERYVREWLAAMVCSKIVEVDASSTFYKLKPEYITILTSDAGSNFMGHLFQYISMFGTVEQPIINCFKNGGGLPYQSYDKFFPIMTQDSAQTVLSSLLSKILPLDNELITKLNAGANVVDIGCGAGKAMILLAKEFPESKFRGYDLCEEPILSASKEAEEANLSNVFFKVFDLAQWDEVVKYDIITAFDVIHDQAHPDVVLRNAYRALKDDGIFLVQDIDASSHIAENADHPVGTLLYTVSTLHCMSVSLSQNGMGLGTMWGRQKALEMFKDAGFSSVEIYNLDHDFMNCYYILKK